MVKPVGVPSEDGHYDNLQIPEKPSILPTPLDKNGAPPIEPLRVSLTHASGGVQEISKEYFGNKAVTHEKVMQLTEDLPMGHFVTVSLYKDPTRSTYMIGQTDQGVRAFVNYSEKEFLGAGSFANVSKVNGIFIKDGMTQQQNLAIKMGVRQNAAAQSYIVKTAKWKNISPEKVKDQDVQAYLKEKNPDKAEEYYSDYQTQKKYLRKPESIQKENSQEYNAQLYLSFLQGDESIAAIPPPYHSVIRLAEGDENHGILMTLREGSLDQLIEEQSLTSQEKDSIADQLSLGLNWMISKGVVLGDIKPQNILVERTEQGEIKVYYSDFGALSFVPIPYEEEIASGNFEKFETTEHRLIEGRDVEIPFSLKSDTITSKYITTDDLQKWKSLYDDLLKIKKTYQGLKDKTNLSLINRLAAKTALKAFNDKYAELKLHIAKTQKFSLGASLYKLYTGSSPFPMLSKGSIGIGTDIYNTFLQSKEDHLALLLDSGCSPERAEKIIQILSN